MSNQAFPVLPLYLLIGVVAIIGLLFVLGDGTPSGEDQIQFVEPDPNDDGLKPFWEKRQTPITEGEVYDFNSEMVCTITVKNWGSGQDEPDRMINNPDGKVGLELILQESECRVARNNGCSGSDWAANLASGVTTTAQHGKASMVIWYPLASDPQATKLIKSQTIPVPPDEIDPSRAGISPGFSKQIRFGECLPHMNWYQGQVYLQRYEYVSQPLAECTRQSIVNVYPQVSLGWKLIGLGMGKYVGNPDEVIIDPVGGQAMTMEEYFANMTDTEKAEAAEVLVERGILEDEDLEPESVVCNMKLNLADPPGFDFLACSPDAFRLAESVTGRNCGIRNLTVKGL